MAGKLLKRIRGKLYNYSFADYFLSCIERYNDIEFRDYCRHRSFSTVKIENILSQSPDRYYYIKSGNAFSGFGAEFRRTVDALYFADHLGLIPYIEYTDEYIYYEDNGVYGITNPFEYYFEQPLSVKKTEITSNPHIMFLEEHRRLIQNSVEYSNSYELHEDYLGLAAEIVRKYIQLNERTDDFFKTTFQNVIGQNTIGVHYRGTDFNVGYKRHPYALSIEDYYAAIDALLEMSPYSDIFVASDEQQAVESFTARYGNRIRYFTDVYRSNDGRPIHFSNNSREYHHYKLGLEILRDIIALSKCNSLIAGLSQVSYCARIYKKSRNEEFKSMSILSKGIV